MCENPYRLVSRTAGACFILMGIVLFICSLGYLDFLFSNSSEPSLLAWFSGANQVPLELHGLFFVCFLLTSFAILASGMWAMKNRPDRRIWVMVLSVIMCVIYPIGTVLGLGMIALQWKLKRMDACCS